MRRRSFIGILLFIVCNGIFIFSYTGIDTKDKNETGYMQYSPIVEDVNIAYVSNKLSNDAYFKTNQRQSPKLPNTESPRKMVSTNRKTLDSRTISSNQKPNTNNLLTNEKQKLKVLNILQNKENQEQDSFNVVAKPRYTNIQSLSFNNKNTVTNFDQKSISKTLGYSNYNGNVFHWGTNSWTVDHKTCNNLINFRNTTLFTKSGPTPIFVYNPDHDIHISSSLIQTGNWEKEIVSPVMKILKTDKELAFVDIGANIGVFSLEFAKLGRNVIAIEPLIGNVKRLCAGVMYGNLSNFVSIIFNAMSNVYSSVLLGRTNNNVGGTFVTRGKAGNAPNVTYYPGNIQTVLLDDLLKLPIKFPKKVVMKIDVEGHEANVLRGAETFFKNIYVKAVAMEWTFSSTPSSANTIIEFMSRFNMKPYDLSLAISLDDIDYSVWPSNIIWQKHESSSPTNSVNNLPKNSDIENKKILQQTLSHMSDIRYHSDELHPFLPKTYQLFPLSQAENQLNQQAVAIQQAVSKQRNSNGKVSGSGVSGKPFHHRSIGFERIRNKNINIYTKHSLKWYRDENICGNVQPMFHTVLYTNSGPTPIFIYDPKVDQWISKDLIKNGVWEKEIANLLYLLLQADKELTFVDIGANIGVFTLEAAKLGRRVISVEPLSSNVQNLCQSVKYGNVSNISIIHNAVSSIRENVTLGQDENNVGGTFVVKDNVAKIQRSNVTGIFKNQIETILLDDLLEIPGAKLSNVLLKIDVEGYEAHVLKGADDFFNSVFVKAVLMEWTYINGGKIAFDIQMFMNRHRMMPYDLSMTTNLIGSPWGSWPPNIVWLNRRYIMAKSDL